MTELTETSESRTVPATARRRRHNRGWVGFAYTLPALVPLTVFVLAPTLAAIGVSFSNWSLAGSTKWIGVQNYSALASDVQFKESLLVTFKIALGIAIPTSLVAFGVALLLNASVRGTSWYLSVLFVPAVLPSIVSALVWGVLFQGNGVLNNLLGTNVGWLTNTRWALPSIVLVLIWTNLGYYTIILLAGIRDVPPQLVEAAKLDGASQLKAIWYIVVPQLRPVILFVMVVATTEALTLFAQPYLLTAGGPADATRPVAELIYDTAFAFANFGKAAAMSVVLLAIAGLLALVQFRIFRRSGS